MNSTSYWDPITNDFPNVLAPIFKIVLCMNLKPKLLPKAMSLVLVGSLFRSSSKVVPFGDPFARVGCLLASFWSRLAFY